MLKSRPGCCLLPGQLSEYRDLLKVGIGQRPWDHYPEGSTRGWEGELSKHKDKIYVNFACKPWDGSYHLKQSPRNHKRKRLTYRCPGTGVQLRRSPKLS